MAAGPLSPKLIYAQEALPPFTGTKLFSIKLTPNYPKPNTAVTAEILTYRFDEDRANIIWQINGKTVAQGLGVKTITFQSPDTGKTQKITAYVTTIEGNQESQLLNLTIHDVDLLVDALTYVPPGYRGKAWPTLQSSIRISAIPYLFKNGKKLPPETLIYEWSFDTKKNIPASGANKDSFVAQLPDSDDYLVTLKLSDQADEINFEKSIMLTARKTSPEIIFYEDNPLEGPIYAKALSGAIKLSQGAINLRAEPFYFSKENISALTYGWSMNDQPTPTEEKPNVLNLRAPENTTGETVINLTIKNLSRLLQSADATLRVMFGQ
ncbi:MAG: hypothetical protein HZC14_01115 [Candidatus Niyogibacteria bacterium]|nr:hypothetical protein [Candidatus Niyogibacteria bacterium]